MKLLCIGGAYHNKKIEPQIEGLETTGDMVKLEQEGLDCVYYVHRMRSDRTVLLYRDLDFDELIKLFVEESMLNRKLKGK